MTLLRSLLISFSLTIGLVSPSLQAQPIELPEGRAISMPVAKQTQYTLDPGRSLSPAEILALPPHAWRRLSGGDPTPNLGLHRGNLWLRLELRSTIEQTAWLVLGNSALKGVRAFTVEQGRPEPIGSHAVISAQGHPALAIHTPRAQPLTILLCIQTSEALITPLQVYTGNALFERNGGQQLLEWTMLAGILALALLSAATRWRANKRGHDWLSGWLLAGAVAYLGKRGELLTITSAFPGGDTRLALFAHTAALAFSILLLARAFNTRSQFPRLHLGYRYFVISGMLLLLPLAAAGNIPLHRILFIACAAILAGMAAITLLASLSQRGPGQGAFAAAVITAISLPLVAWGSSQIFESLADYYHLALLGSILVPGALFLHGLDQQFQSEQARDSSQTMELALAQARDSSFSELMSRVSFNLRPALEGFYSLVALLARAKLEPAPARIATHLGRSSARLRTAVDNLEDLARLNRSSITLERSDAELDVMLCGVVKTMLSRARAMGLTLGLEIGPELPVSVVGDVRRTTRLLIGLLEHAMQNAYRGHISLKAERAPATEAGPLRIRFTIEDNSIHASHQRNARSNIVESTGGLNALAALNLEASRRLAEEMGGEFSINAPRTGATSYELILAMEPGAEPPPSVPPGLRDEVLLLVDNDSADRLALIDEVRDWGMQPLCASDMQAGTELLDGNTPPQIIAFNPRLPEASQWRSATLLAEIDSLPRDGLIVLASKDMSALRAGEELAGALFLAKPLRPAVLGHMMGELIALNGERETLIRHRPLTVVVDDNPINARLLRHQLERLGFNPHVCVDGQEALDFTEQYWDSVTAVIADSELPRLGGTDMPRALRLLAARRAEAAPPLLALSAQQDANFIAELERAGAQTVLSKPVSSVALARELRRALVAAQV